MAAFNLVSFSYEQGKSLLEQRKLDTLKEYGQFLTPPAVACYMAKQLGPIQNGAVFLEPAIGSGVLVAALIERLVSDNQPIEISIDAYEIDKELCEIARQVLSQASQKAEQSGIKIHWQVHQEDFLIVCLPEAQPALFSNNNTDHRSFDFMLSNPPYFKLNAEDKRVKAASGKINGHTNIYTLFMALSTKLLVPHGKACFIVPRSFCSGVYFSDFRRDLMKDVKPLAVHLFQSRNDVFKNDEVLQENVIFTFEKTAESKRQPYFAGQVSISTSKDDASLDTPITRQVSFGHFLSQHDGQFFFRLPTGVLDEQILDAVDRWDGSLERYGLQVSTGRVVPFRANSLLRDQVVSGNGTAPLLWMQNVKPYRVEYPLNGFTKPQAISIEDASLLVPNSNYVLLRRFSAKEDRRRLVCAPFLADQFDFEQIGFENHLNFIYRKKSALQAAEALGLSALLNSAIVDRYFRIVNGNTQVNAADLRALPLPPMEIIRQIGEEIQKAHHPQPEQVDNIVFATLWQTQFLAEEFPMIKETRITMGKIEQAHELLESLGLPPAQQNEISALTLLALAQLSENTPWSNATPRNLRVHDMLVEIKERYGREYAENSRESVRRQVLHQFEQAGVIIRNPDDPARATNSGNTNYVLTDIALDAIRVYGSPEWKVKRDAFLFQRGALLETYQKTREQIKVPLQVAEGIVYKLSPGKHNELQAAIINEFGPRFASGAKLIYLGDTARKMLIFEKELFAKLGVPVSDHGKFPDIILFDEQKNWIFLIEAVTSHGPVSPKRHMELEKLFKNCTADRVYVTAFFDFATYKRFVSDISWETEVWIAETPSHMIHLNGERFQGPYKKTP
ncbi:MAG: BsuBI/PstI family type II restriction endonuclease [Anaerolineales bacterium]